MTTLTAAPGLGPGGLVTLTTGPGRARALSPDAVIEYLIDAGRPAVFVPGPAALHACPVLALAAERGLCRPLTVGLGDGTHAEWTDLRPAWSARHGELPTGHPTARLLCLLPHATDAMLARLVGWLLHPAQATHEAAGLPLCVNQLTPRLTAALLGGPGSRAWTAAQPGGFYARLATRAGPGRVHPVRARLLADLAAVWRGGEPAGLDADPDARKVWDSWTPF